MAKLKKKKDTVVLTARDLLKGYTADKYDTNLYNMSPLQMIPAEEKDEEWKKWNLDWLERVAMRQLSSEVPTMLKNYNLANGIIDKNDYMLTPDNDYRDQIQTLVNDNNSTLPIKFFPIIPNVVNVMVGEFTKRDNRIIVTANDMFTQTELENKKKEDLTNILLAKAEQDKLFTLQSMGIDLESKEPDVQELIQKELAMAKEIEELKVKYKNYRTIPEQWANHVIQSDNDRFKLYQLETIGFRDMLITDKEFWHIRVHDDDYEIELWNPIHVFYHKNKHTQYTDEGNYAGRQLMMSIPEVIDVLGPLMNESQILELKNGYKILSNLPLVNSGNADQTHWYSNFSKPYPNSITNVTWGQYMDGKFMQKMANELAGNKVAPTNHGFDFSWYDLNNLPTDYMTAMDTPGMVRVTEVYWKSQRRIGKLVSKTIDGNTIIKTIDENYKVTVKPVYNKDINQKESAENLVYGEHIDWTWVNEVRYGIKINSALSSYYTRNYSTFEPIYIGGDPIPFQFKGEDQIYNSRIPVIGFIASERNAISMSMVSKMKSYQIYHNIVNNQNLEMLADDIGKVIVIDQNMIPRNSLNGEWGKYNIPMFYQVMKDYQIAALDTNIRNTENPTNFQHFQQVDLSKTEQILTRIKLSEWSKLSALEVIGITPQRLGSVAASESATGVRQAVNNSYAQTENYFDQHMNHLMPRVRQMALDAAQYIASTKPESRISYLSTNEEREWFSIEGYKLLLRDFRIHAKSTANIKELTESLRRLAFENNTAGGSLYEYAQMITLQSPSEIISKLKEADDRKQQELKDQREHELQLQQMRDQAIEKEAQREDFWKAKEIEKDILIAQIQHSGNDVSETADPASFIDLQQKQQMNDAIIQDMEHKRLSDKNLKGQELALKREELQLKRDELLAKERIESVKAKVALKNKVSGEK